MFSSDVTAKFWDRVERAGWGECWLWKAGANSAGYGVISVEKKPMLAHRLSLSLSLGYRVPKGQFVLHSCDTPRCCNPQHLRLGTQTDNVRDAMARGRHVMPPVHFGPASDGRGLKGAENSQAKLTDRKVRSIHDARLKGEAYKSIARRYRLDASTVKAICQGTTWGHVFEHPRSVSLQDLQAVPIERKPSAKITAEIARDIKNRLSNGETGRSIAVLYGLHFASVSDIKRGKTWRDA